MFNLNKTKQRKFLIRRLIAKSLDKNSEGRTLHYDNNFQKFNIPSFPLSVLDFSEYKYKSRHFQSEKWQNHSYCGYRRDRVLPL
jgi:hypothetical protein